jgi:hypothetical protein
VAVEAPSSPTPPPLLSVRYISFEASTAVALFGLVGRRVQSMTIQITNWREWLDVLGNPHPEHECLSEILASCPQVEELTLRNEVDVQRLCWLVQIPNAPHLRRLKISVHDAYYNEYEYEEEDEGNRIPTLIQVTPFFEALGNPLNPLVSKLEKLLIFFNIRSDECESFLDGVHTLLHHKTRLQKIDLGVERMRYYGGRGRADAFLAKYAEAEPGMCTIPVAMQNKVAFLSVLPHATVDVQLDRRIVATMFEFAAEVRARELAWNIIQ